LRKSRTSSCGQGREQARPTPQEDNDGSLAKQDLPGSYRLEGWIHRCPISNAVAHTSLKIVNGGDIGVGLYDSADVLSGDVHALVATELEPEDCNIEACVFALELDELPMITGDLWAFVGDMRGTTRPGKRRFLPTLMPLAGPESVGTFFGPSGTRSGVELSLVSDAGMLHVVEALGLGWDQAVPQGVLWGQLTNETGAGQAGVTIATSADSPLYYLDDSLQTAASTTNNLGFFMGLGPQDPSAPLMVPGHPEYPALQMQVLPGAVLYVQWGHQ